MHIGCWRHCFNSRHVMGPGKIANSLSLIPSRPFHAGRAVKFTALRRTSQITNSQRIPLYQANNGIPIRLYRSNSSDIMQRHVRHISWTTKPNSRPVEFNGLSDEQEDAAKAAILEKVMKGRQPTDLMLRCESNTPIKRR